MKKNYRNKENTGLLIRIDDVTDHMNWELMDKCEELFDKFEIKPLLGVIPNNQDPEFKNFPKRENFWGIVRNWQKKGWEISMHGFNHIYETDDDWILDSLDSKVFLSNHRASINIQGIVHNYVLTDTGWELTYFTSDNENPLKERPHINDDADFHYGDIIGFSNNPNVPIRKTCYGTCSETRLEFGSAPISISNDTVFTSTGCLINKQGATIIELYNHFDIQKILPTESIIL